MLMQLMLYSLRRTKTLTHRCTHVHRRNGKVFLPFIICNVQDGDTKWGGTGCEWIQMPTCRSILFFSPRIIFFLCLLFVWWTERGGENERRRQAHELPRAQSRGSPYACASWYHTLTLRLRTHLHGLGQYFCSDSKVHSLFGQRQFL